MMFNAHIDLHKHEIPKGRRASFAPVCIPRHALPQRHSAFLGPATLVESATADLYNGVEAGSGTAMRPTGREKRNGDGGRRR